MDLIAGVPVRQRAESKIRRRPPNRRVFFLPLMSSSFVRSHEGFRVIKTQRGETEREACTKREGGRTENRQEDVDDCTAAGR